MKIIAVVVTYNRLPLLKECIQALLSQTKSLQNIVIINNGSNDGTTEWLAQQPHILTVNQENLGGSDGFFKGIKKAYSLEADWIWVMDDDTVPLVNALEKLLKPVDTLSHLNVGFLCSRVEWTDGSPHLMNIPHVQSISRGGVPFNVYDKNGCLTVSACSFVSILISAKAVAKVGLPYKEFFIWGDDLEYSQRITRAGFYGGYVPDSVVLHKTGQNYSADIYGDDDKSLWKYKYGIRNSLFMVKAQKGSFSYFTKLLKQLFVIPIRIMKKRKSHKLAFIKTNWTAAIRSIGFSPKIEFP